MRLHRACALMALSVVFSACGEDSPEYPSDDMGGNDAGTNSGASSTPDQAEHAPADTTTTPSAEPAPSVPPPPASSVEPVPAASNSAAQIDEIVNPEPTLADADGGVREQVDAGQEQTQSSDPLPEAGAAQGTEFTITWVESEAFVGGAPLEYGGLEVPVDYANPEGEKLQLSLARARTLSSDRTGVLMYNPGGPGPALVYDAEAELSNLRTLFPTFDIVLMDNRGTGFSSSLGCISFDDTDAMDAQLEEIAAIVIEEAGGTLSEEDEMIIELASRSFTVTSFQEGCLQAYPNALSFFNTENVARDMDAVRAALGEEQLNYWGVSYGTVQGSLFAKLFPERVRAFALDSVVLRNEELTYVDDVKATTAAYEEQLNRFFDATEQDPDSLLHQHPGGTPAQIFDGLNAQLEAGVQWEQDKLPSFLLTAITSNILRGGYWESLAGVLYDAALGDWEYAKLWFDNGETSRQAEERDWAAYQAGALIRLTDMPCPAQYTPEQAKQDYLDLMQRNPRMAPAFASLVADCAAWTQERSEPRLLATELQSRPLLLLNGLNDPATPYLDALTMLDAFNNGSRLVTGNIEGHGVGPSGDCGRSALTQFMLSADVNNAPEVCLPGEQVAAARSLRQLAARRNARPIRTRVAR